MAELPAPVCANCRSRSPLPGYPTPLCLPCREKLIRFPVPVWMRISAGLILLVMIYSAVTRLPAALSADLAFDRGKIAAAQGDYPAARHQFTFALTKYPSAGQVLSALAIAASHAGDQETADASLQRLKVLAQSDDSQAELLTRTQSQMNAK
jgi:tetratricopeptide (TPR) repeat protein